MASEKKGMPHTQTSAPAKDPRTTRDVTDRPRRDAPEEAPRRQAGDAEGTHGDQMPKGADEPGAGM